MPEQQRDEQGRFTKEAEFYGSVTGSTYPTVEARDYYERIAAQRLANDPNDDPLNPNYDGPTAEDIKRAHQIVEDAQHDKAKDLADERAAAVFWRFCHSERPNVFRKFSTRQRKPVFD